MEEAETARKEYLAKQGQKKPSFWAQIAGLFGFGGSGDELTRKELMTSDGRGTSDVNDVDGIYDDNDEELTTPDVKSTSGVQGGTSDVKKDGDNGDTSGDTKMSPTLSPVLSPKLKVSPSVSPRLLPKAGEGGTTITPAQFTVAAPQFIEVVKIQDGDTVQLTNGMFVRLIGVDAPEKDEFYYREAGDKLAELVLNKVVRLERDISHTDTFGRLLRDVYIFDAIFINLEMVKGGYARALAILPDTKYADQLKTAEKEAKAKCLGVWGQSGCVSIKEDKKVPGLQTATKGKVVINEIAWAGTQAGPTHEWFELYNTENYDIDISGWTIKAEDGTPEIIISGLTRKELMTSDGRGTSDVINSRGTSDVITTIKARNYFLFERTDDTAVNNIVADQIYAGVLSNEGEALKLIDSAGTVVDSVGKEGEAWPAGSSIGKISMERITALNAGDIASNWKSFTGNQSAKDASGNFINGTPKASNSVVTVVVTGSGGGGGGAQTPSPSLSPSPDLSSPLLQVVINEIAWMGTATSSNDEWLELHNTTDQTIDLTGWTLKSLTGASPDPQITLSGAIGPFGFYLLERTDDITISDILADKIYTGALSDTGEMLELRNSSGTLQDKIYGDFGWYAGNKDTRSSMERINPRISGNNSANWNANNGVVKNGKDAAGNSINGTPRAKNSGYVAGKPSAVANLVATINSPLTVAWSAPEDLDTLPASLSYDLRYSTSVFSSASADIWDAATRVASSSLPSVGEKGASQSAYFNISSYGQKWYFALKTKLKKCGFGACDEESNISNITDITISSAVSSAAWAMFGKDQYHTSLANIAGPGATATISREFDAGLINAVSQPVADADGNIYFGAANGSAGKLIKLNKNMVKQWEYSTNVSIGAPAVLSDGTVYFGRVGAGGTLAFTALASDGSNKWDYADASAIKAVAVSSKGEPYFTYSSGADKLAVLNIDGSMKTSFPKSASGLAGFTPVVLDNGAIITASKVSGNQFFTAYASSGAQIWQVFYAGANGNAPADPSYDTSTGKTYSAAGRKLFNIPSNPPDGSTINSTDIASFDYTAATAVAIGADTLYVGFNGPAPAVISTTSEGSIFANDTGVGSEMWNNPQRASVENGSYATTFLTINTASASHYLKATGFALSVPENAIINGVKVQILKSNSCVCMKDHRIRLVKKGNIDGEDRANTSVWPNPDAYIAHGGASDLWGLSLTPADVNASNFGVAISARNTLTGASAAGIDNIKITVYYTEAERALLYALNKADFSVKWSFQADGYINKQIVADNADNVYFSTQNGKLYNVNSVGTQSWVINSGQNSTISPALTKHGLVWGYGNKAVLVSD